MRDLGVLILSSLVLLVSTLARPTTVRCPRGWWAEGVRPDGETTCRLPAPSDCPSNKPCADGYVETTLSARVYCPDDEQPVALDDGRTVVCRRAR